MWQLHQDIIPPGKRVLELGCATGRLLKSLNPNFGVGIDHSERLLATSSVRNDSLTFVAGDAHSMPIQSEFDFVVASDLLGHLDDVLTSLRQAQAVLHSDGRLVITSYNAIWHPILSAAEKLGLKMPVPSQNWLSVDDIKNLLHLSGFEVVDHGLKMLFPYHVPIVSNFANRFLARLPILKHLCLIQWFVAQNQVPPKGAEETVSVVIPCRNEAGNIRECIDRVPTMGLRTEIIVIDGSSNDGTYEIVENMLSSGKYPNLMLMQQIETNTPSQYSSDSKMMLPQGKGDAVRKAFAKATGDIVMILDADMTVQPEDLTDFYIPLRDSQAQFVNGVRLVYPHHDRAFRALNLLGNKIFSLIFTWLLQQPIKDTLCGTKSLRRSDYQRIARGRSYFGNIDPFGDFDLLLGAGKLNMRIVDMPIRYQERISGDTKVSVWQHGPLLLRITLVAIYKMKLRPLISNVLSRIFN